MDSTSSAVPYRGIILTGTSGAGKSTLSSLLRQTSESFEQVKAVTTRTQRPDDDVGTYDYLTEEEFDQLGESLLIWAGYRDRRYGITRGHITELEDRNKVPMMLITAQSLAEYLERGGSTPPFLTVFVDAPDAVLDSRLAQRDLTIDWARVKAQRAEDRRYLVAADHVLNNLDLDQSISYLRQWWRPDPTAS